MGGERKEKPWRITYEDEWLRKEIKFGEDKVTGKPAVKLLRVDRYTGTKEHEVYIWSDTYGWVRVHYDIDGYELVNWSEKALRRLAQRDLKIKEKESDLE